MGGVWVWALWNAMKINPGKSRVQSFTRGSGEEPSKLFFGGDQRIPETRSSKSLGINLASDVSCSEQTYCTVQAAWRALYLITRVLKKGNCNTKSLHVNSGSDF